MFSCLLFIRPRKFLGLTALTLNFFLNLFQQIFFSNFICRFDFFGRSVGDFWKKISKRSAHRHAHKIHYKRVWKGCVAFFFGKIVKRFLSGKFLFQAVFEKMLKNFPEKNATQPFIVDFVWKADWRKFWIFFSTGICKWNYWKIFVWTDFIKVSRLRPWFLGTSSIRHKYFLRSSEELSSNGHMKIFAEFKILLRFLEEMISWRFFSKSFSFENLQKI